VEGEEWGGKGWRKTMERKGDEEKRGGKV